MLKRAVLKKGLAIGIGLASIAGKKAEKEISAALRKEGISKKKVAQSAKRIAGVALREGMKVEKVIMAEIRKEISKAKPAAKKLAKKAINRAKKKIRR